jgi:hypothetical protein
LAAKLEVAATQTLEFADEVLGGGSASIARSSICRIDAIWIISATAQTLPVANRAKRKVSAAGHKNRTTKTTSARRKIACVSKSGEKAIPGTGAKRVLHSKNRYKISAGLKSLRMRKLKQ